MGYMVDIAAKEKTRASMLKDERDSKGDWERKGERDGGERGGLREGFRSTNW